jgi:hypothetical protein
MKSGDLEYLMALSAVTDEAVTPLVPGDFLTRTEFLQRWENMPQLTRAELIRGIVYMPSPLSREHGVLENNVAGWPAVYRAATPGTEAANNATWLMGEDAPSRTFPCAS